ncbi:MAG: FecR domain-containing protein [Butyricimonas faecalis]
MVQGSVAILRDGQPEKKIKPGEQAYYNKGVGTLSVSSVDVNEFTAWKDGLFYFKDIALEEILRIVARWYDLEIFYMNRVQRVSYIAVKCQCIPPWRMCCESSKYPEMYGLN